MAKKILRILAGIGKPVYFLISRIGLVILLVLFVIGRGVRRLSPKIPKGQINLPVFLRLLLLKIQLRLTQKHLKFGIKYGLILAFIIIASLISYFYFFVVRGLPPAKNLTDRQIDVSTKIYDRNGELLYKIYKDKNRTIIPLSQIPPHVRLATLAAEDAEFYNHPGFSARGIFRAFKENLKTGTLQGGSTITQQLVKNVLLSPEKTLTRKLKELILALEVEANYTKDQILEMYLNEVSYGGAAYGIEEASRLYFGKDVDNLDLAEAAFLAGLPKSPTAYSPFGQNPDSAFGREKEVLKLMRINRYITRSQEEEAAGERLTFAPVRISIKAPHFVMYVRQILVDKYGEDMVEKGGLEVTTSLDLSVQQVSEKIVKDEIVKLKSLNVGNGAALVINPVTGEILSMVGSKDYFDLNYDGQVNVTTSLRQPGSSIKVVNYVHALSFGGFTASSVIDDSPITYSVAGQPPYTPVNYDGKFRGPVSLRSALAESRNIPAVKVLASYGVSKMVDQGTIMGITSWKDPSKFGLSLTLGGGSITPLDLAKVYSVIANQGKRPDFIPVLEVKDYKGKVLEKNDPKSSQAIGPGVAFILTDILKDNNARAPEFGTNSYLVIKNHPEVAVKTGTSNDLRDNWTVGYNQKFLVVTWVGNNDNSPMSKIASGVTGASPIWNKIMSTLLANEPSIGWNVPDGVSKMHVCPGSPKQEWFLAEKGPSASDCKSQKARVEEGQILDSGISTGD